MRRTLPSKSRNMRVQNHRKNIQMSYRQRNPVASTQQTTSFRRSENRSTYRPKVKHNTSTRPRINSRLNKKNTNRSVSHVRNSSTLHQRKQLFKNPRKTRNIKAQKTHRRIVQISKSKSMSTKRNISVQTKFIQKKSIPRPTVHRRVDRVNRVNRVDKVDTLSVKASKNTMNAKLRDTTSRLQKENNSTFKPNNLISSKIFLPEKNQSKSTNYHTMNMKQAQDERERQIKQNEQAKQEAEQTKQTEPKNQEEQTEEAEQMKQTEPKNQEEQTEQMKHIGRVQKTTEQYMSEEKLQKTLYATMKKLFEDLNSKQQSTITKDSSLLKNEHLNQIHDVHNNPISVYTQLSVPTESQHYTYPYQITQPPMGLPPPYTSPHTIHNQSIHQPVTYTTPTVQGTTPTHFDQNLVPNYTTPVYPSSFMQTPVQDPVPKVFAHLPPPYQLPYQPTHQPPYQPTHQPPYQPTLQTTCQRSCNTSAVTERLERLERQPQQYDTNTQQQDTLKPILEILLRHDREIEKINLSSSTQKDGDTDNLKHSINHSLVSLMNDSKQGDDKVNKSIPPIVKLSPSVKPSLIGQRPARFQPRIVSKSSTKTSDKAIVKPTDRQHDSVEQNERLASHIRILYEKIQSLEHKS